MNKDHKKVQEILKFVKKTRSKVATAALHTLAHIINYPTTKILQLVYFVLQALKIAISLIQLEPCAHISN